MLRQLVYISSSLSENPRDDVLAFIDKARRRNEANGVTGYLLFADGTFLQVLEGEPEKVQETLDLVKADGRHTGVIVLIDIEAVKRRFDGWSMGWRELAKEHEVSRKLNSVKSAREVSFDRSGDGALIDTLMRSVFTSAEAGDVHTT